MEIPNAEQVATSWCRTVFATSALVHDASSNKLPDIKRWTKPVYILAQSIGTGGVDIYSPEYNPTIRLSFFAAPDLFGECFSAAERARYATYTGAGLGTLTVKSGFYPVKLSDVSIFSDSRAVRDDPAALARVQMEIQLTYVIPERVSL
jgi:hypothetical protein